MRHCRHNTERLVSASAAPQLPWKTWELAKGVQQRRPQDVAIIVASVGDSGAPRQRCRVYGARVAPHGGANWRGVLGGLAHAPPAIGDKFSRAQPVAARWNDEKVLMRFG